MRRFSIVVPAHAMAAAIAIVFGALCPTVGAPPNDPYRSRILQHDPALYWSFENTADNPETGTVRVGVYDSLVNSQPAWSTQPSAQPVQRIAGPVPDEFPLFEDSNAAVELGAGRYLRVADQGESSPLDFDLGDALTLEAWVAPRTISSGGYAYIVGKGRTHLPGMAKDSHNYALRLAGKGSGAAISFLFRSRGPDGDWHRWTSNASFAVNDGWHHVAVTYEFGKSDSLQGFIDGAPVTGKWDMGGPTDQPPVVDDDELWLGSSMGGNANSTLRGGLDEVAIYRRALTPKQIGSHYLYSAQDFLVDRSLVPDNELRVEIFEGIPDGTSWRFRRPKLTDSFRAQTYAFSAIPTFYNARGVPTNRANPFLLRALSIITLPPGPHRLAVRSRNASRLYVDDVRVAETDFHRIPSSGHGQVIPLDTSLGEQFRPVARGDSQTVVEWVSDGRPHLFRFEMIVGGRKHRPEFGETCVAIQLAGGDTFNLLSPSAAHSFELTDAGWNEFLDFEHEQLLALNQSRRRQLAAAEDAYWDRRHAYAQTQLVSHPATQPPDIEVPPEANAVDRFIAARLQTAAEKPTPLVSRLEFLRRLSLDTVGTVPSEDEVRRMQAEDRPDWKQHWVDYYLQQRGWADHWVSYWQDVLAENPNIVNPTLNNTGPFRWWIYEAFLDNRRFDRFATELIMMEGSQRYGGPAGFELATENDVPLAAKAQIIGQAFLGLEMKCARCHDAPFHDFDQRDLFSLAAMLNRGPQPVPSTSSIPGDDDALASLVVEVTLKPGERVVPGWAFPDINSEDLPPDFIRDPQDSREQLARYVTAPANQRFAEVIVNRMWKRYMGHGLVEPVDDWQAASASHPELLRYLAAELVHSGYDLKHIARLLLNSQLYQRQAVDPEQVPQDGLFRFPGPLKRRLSAEQIVDSLFVVSGKRMDAGRICIDIDGARFATQSIDLGIARRAWQFTSLSNERDRPSLAMPFAQPYVTLLETFGWRSSRQNPLTVRDEQTTVLQPAAIANGTLARDIVRITDDSGWLSAVKQSETAEELLERLYLRVLARTPSDRERKVLSEYLRPGFAQRLAQPQPSSTKAAAPQRLKRGWISWSNHLNPEASRVKHELEMAVQRGPQPTQQLTADYRQRVEDVVWVLLNSPEFIFNP